MKGLRGHRSLHNNMMKYLPMLLLDLNLTTKYPGIENDKLFDSKYRYISGNRQCNQSGCNRDTVTHQRLQDTTNISPGIHFGLIASGDSVITSGEIRDRISAADGVVAFKMEGAGVWDVFPCVVIKAGCDYTDGHINKMWRRYAAATAAACMKAFFEYLGAIDNTTAG